MPDPSLPAGKQERFCHETFGIGFASSRDSRLGCHRQLLPEQPLRDALRHQRPNHPTWSATHPRFPWENSPGSPQRGGRGGIDMQERRPSGVLPVMAGAARVAGEPIAPPEPFIWSLGDPNEGATGASHACSPMRAAAPLSSTC